MRPFLSFPARSDRRFAVIGPVICQSPAVAPSVPVTWVILQETLQVSGAFTPSDTGTILPFGGQSAPGEATTLEFANANEYGANDAGGLGTPRADAVLPKALQLGRAVLAQQRAVLDHRVHCGLHLMSYASNVG